MLNKAPCRKFIKRGASTEEDDIDVEMEEQCIAPPCRILKKPVLLGFNRPIPPLPPIFSPLSTSTTDLSNNFLGTSLQETLPTIAYSKKKRMPSRKMPDLQHKLLDFLRPDPDPPLLFLMALARRQGPHAWPFFSRQACEEGNVPSASEAFQAPKH
ncbi:hypothetical protein BC829DRAFT_158794 [Chytridium lagenaria]|nr:hypothetical protein BC829DRAFT_158794 [Chytridium lagenaria]